MPWDLIISASADNDGTPLGTLEAVKNTLRAALPNIEFEEEPSGADMLASGIRFPPTLHDFLASRPASCAGEVSSDDLNLRFDLGSETEIRMIPVEVRGGGDPLPALHRLAQVSGWAIVDSSSGESIVFDTSSPEGLARYRRLVARIVELGPDANDNNPSA